MAMSQAWHAGVIAKSMETPPLSDLMGDGEDGPIARREQSDEEMAHNLRLWKVVLGDV